MSDSFAHMIPERESVRRKPALYFGENGSAAISRMVEYVLRALVDTARVGRGAEIRVTIRRRGKGCAVAVKFAGIKAATSLEKLVTAQSGKRWKRFEFGIVAAASDTFAMTTCGTNGGRRLEVRNGTKFTTRKVNETKGTGMTITFAPAPVPFSFPTAEQCETLAGILRDYSMLRAGLATRLEAEMLGGTVAYFYREGMKSFLFEEDHQRLPLHPGSLSFCETGRGMSVEGHLRFLHAGVPSVRSYVNFERTQGGSHLEGLGKALQKLFPDPFAGCRPVRFVTNPDTGARVVLPYPFLGALHVKMDLPRYLGPTKDVVWSEELRDFVKDAALAALPAQWKSLRDRRLL